MDQVVIIDGLRTPVGVLGGALKDIPAEELLRQVFAELLRRTAIDPAQIDEVIAGCGFNPSNAPNVARVAALLAGVPKTVPGATINVNCGSAMKALTFAYQAVKAGEGDVFVVGGTESMSNIPYILHKARFGGYRFGNGELVDMLWESLTDPVCGQLMGRTAENLVEEFGITREEQDDFALESHHKAVAAARTGKFNAEIVPVKTVKKSKAGSVEIVALAEDEGPRPDLTREQLSGLRAAFKEGGSVTAGNSCGINDGASAVLVMSAGKAKELGLKPKAVIRSIAWVGLEPQRMGLGPALALPKALKYAGLNLEELDAIEINEAFAAQVLSCLRVLPVDRNKLNLNGGAIPLGHAVGSTGTRLIITLMNILEQNNFKSGAASMCVGGGQGGAVVLERFA
ncbi:acetyl-CoA C-acetyltransferase [Paradesulfitobacterium aromaticivorans]